MWVFIICHSLGLVNSGWLYLPNVLIMKYVYTVFDLAFIVWFSIAIKYCEMVDTEPTIPQPNPLPAVVLLPWQLSIDTALYNIPYSGTKSSVIYSSFSLTIPYTQLTTPNDPPILAKLPAPVSGQLPTANVSWQHNCNFHTSSQFTYPNAQGSQPKLPPQPTSPVFAKQWLLRGLLRFPTDSTSKPVNHLTQTRRLHISKRPPHHHYHH